MAKKKRIARKPVKKPAFRPSRNHYLFLAGFIAIVLFIVTAVRGYWGILVNPFPINNLFGQGISINDNGEVLIYGGSSMADLHPMIWKDALVAEVNKSAFSPIYKMDPNPNIFNNNGEFVGYDTSTGSPIGPFFGFIWRKGSGMERFGMMIDGMPLQNVKAMAINNLSQVVGTFQFVRDPCRQRLFVWQNGSYKTFNNTTLSCDVVPTDINDNGIIVGYQTTDDQMRHAFMLNSNTGEISEITGTGYTNIFPWSINNYNNVVGYANLVGDATHTEKAFLVMNGVFTPLGALGGNRSIAFTINDNNVVAGKSSVKTGLDEYHAFVIEENSDRKTMVDLGVLDVVEGVQTIGSTALSVNTIGIIVGTNYNFDTKATPDPASGTLAYYQIPMSWDYVLTKIKKPKNIRNPNITDTPTPKFISPTPSPAPVE